MTDAVTVSVRCCPFTKTELASDGDLGLCCVSMHGHSTIITTPGTETSSTPLIRKFNFDHSFFSHDPQDPNFISQPDVFNTVGATVVNSALSGYNTTIFAYGQTGSGKSYTMMGNPTSDTHRGLIPRISMSLFEQIEAATLAAETGTGEDADWISGLDPKSGHEYWYNTVTEESSWTKPSEQPVSKTSTSSSTLNPDQDVHYRVECSYLEIYNEQVRDLLANANANDDPSKTPEHRAFGLGKQKSASTMLKVREHPKNGPYVEGLKSIAVESYNDIDALIKIGGACRVVASTQMNTESSRSHAIFKIRFTRTTVDHAAGKATDRVADINLGTNFKRWRRERWPSTHQQHFLFSFFLFLFLFFLVLQWIWPDPNELKKVVQKVLG